MTDSRVIVRLACILLLATLPAAECQAHPDLLAQITALDEKLATTPMDAELLLQRGDLYRRHEDYEQAARDFAEAAAADPGHPRLNFYLGQLAYEAGNPSEAENYLRVFLAANPRHSKAWKIRGQASVRRGEFDIAAVQFGSAISTTESPSPGLYRQKIISEVAAGKQSWESALVTVDEGLGIFGPEVNMLGLGTDIALAMESVEQARSFISALPGKLQELPAWKERLELLHCLDGKIQVETDTCSDQAQARLGKLVAAFRLE